MAAESHIRMSYRPLLANIFPAIAREVFSITEFAARETAGGRTNDGFAPDGIYERLIHFTDLEFTGEDPFETMNEFSQHILRLHAWPTMEGSFETLSTYFAGWKAGQTFRITSEAFDIFDLESWVKRGKPAVPSGSNYSDTKEPIRVWVKAVRTTILSPTVLHHRIIFTNQYNVFGLFACISFGHLENRFSYPAKIGLGLP